MHNLVKLKLTTLSLAFMLSALSQQTKAGIETPHKANTGHFYQWFFYALQTAIREFSVYCSLWWSVLSNPSNGWPGLAGSLNLMHSTAKRLRPMGCGLFSFTRNCHVTN